MWEEVQWARKKSRHPNLSRKSLELVQSRQSLTAVRQEVLQPSPKSLNPMLLSLLKQLFKALKTSSASLLV